MPAVQLNPAAIARLRDELDTLDESPVELVAQRCRLALGEEKRAARLPLRDPIEMSRGVQSEQRT